MTTEHRRTGLTDDELDIIANKLSEKMIGVKPCVVFTPAEHQEIRNILSTKKRAVTLTLSVAGLIILWAFKGAIAWIISHLSWGK